MKAWLKDKIKELYPDVDFDVMIPPNEKLGDYSINLPFVLAKKENKKPTEISKEILQKLEGIKEFDKYFKEMKLAGGGYINFYLSDDFVRQQLQEISRNKTFGYHDTLKGKRVVVEYTDPNPFKLFHIGHLMSNTIGETIARLYEALGADLRRVNYQGDVGLHVAKAVWGMRWMPDENNKKKMPDEDASLDEKIIFLGEAYAFGSLCYENQSDTRVYVEEINKHIFEKDDKDRQDITELYKKGRRWSLEYFDKIYKKLGTKFDEIFFESEIWPDGFKIVKENMPQIFSESGGAIVFKGEQYGLHTRVFINSQGLPTYEAKELGLNKKKFEMYSPDLSIIVTGNEINDYFKVLLKAMELIMPEAARITRHIGHGMMRFASGKMSSRTGNIITAESLIEQVVAKIKEKETENSSKKTQKEYESLAVSAIKYMVLKHNIGSDIIFDFDQALSIKGDAAPYLQYTYARLKSILSKGMVEGGGGENIDLSVLGKEELKLIKQLLIFPDIIKNSAENHTPNALALYLYELTTQVNYYYERVRILSDETKKSEREARLLLVETMATILKRGLNLLGIETLERI